MQRNWKIYQNIIGKNALIFLFCLVEPTLRASFFDNIMTPDTLIEGNVVAANGEFVAVSLMFST